MNSQVVVIWAVGFIPWFLQEGDWPWNLTWGLRKAGEFGDSFGFINSLVSSLALVGVIAAIWLQKKELTEQRKELIITQWEMKKSVEAQSGSQRELARQAGINLQSVILSSLQGMHEYATALLESKENAEREEGRSTIKFIQQLRQTVLVELLRGREGFEIRTDIIFQFDRWVDLTAIIERCSQLRRMAVDILYIREYDEETGANLGDRKIKGCHEASDAKVERLVTQLESDLPLLSKSLTATGDSPEVFVAWLAVAKQKGFQAVPDDLPARLDNLIKMCERCYEKARNDRSQTF